MISCFVRQPGHEISRALVGLLSLFESFADTDGAALGHMSCGVIEIEGLKRLIWVLALLRLGLDGNFITLKLFYFIAD